MLACNSVTLKVLKKRLIRYFSTIWPMAAYLFVNIEVKDQTAYAEYRSGVSPVIYKHGGEYLARGGAAEAIEGDWTPSRVVLLKFPDMKALKAFLDDPEYQPLKDLRVRAAESQMLAVEGI
jgi:uncharacterized protein (DUF1330 family)